jgi:hypothetical protein
MMGRTPDLVVERISGGGGGPPFAWDWAVARAVRPRVMRRGVYILGWCMV